MVEMKKVQGIEYGNTSWTIRVPESAIVFENLPAEQVTPALPDPAEAVRHALENPLGMDGLSEMVKRGSKVTIGFHTHGGHSIISAPIVLEELHEAGVEDSDITFMPGLGCYPKLGRRELLGSDGPDYSQTAHQIEVHQSAAGAAMLPPEIVNRFWPRGTVYSRGIRNPDCSDPNELAFLGYSKLGDYVEYNKCVQDSDLIIFLGGCFAPLGTYGGYGGSSGVTVGFGSAKAIGSTHTYSIIGDPGAIHCSPRNNLYREHKHAIQDRIEDTTGKLIFNVDGFPNINSEWCVFNAGHYREIQEPTWRVLDKERIVELLCEVDVTICGCGPQTTYDHSNNPLAVLASQVSSHPLKDFVGKPFLRKGGVFIVAATCDGRISEARQSDQEVIKIFNREGQSAANLVDYEDEFNHRDDYIFRYRHARAFHPSHPFWLLYNAQWALDNYTVICAGAQNPEAARSVGMVPAKDFASAWTKATEILGEKEPLALVLPNRTKRGGVIFKAA
jgi:hypothetical protein